MNCCFIILAGGESKRFNSNTPKPYTKYKGKPLLLHSIDKAKVFNKFEKIVLVINKKHKNYIKSLNIKNINIITGGKTRAESAYIALKNIKRNNFKNVIIHDAARPNFSLKLLKKLMTELKLISEFIVIFLLVNSPLIIFIFLPALTNKLASSVTSSLLLF